MGWTKHPDAVQAIQRGRTDALSSLKTVAKKLHKELKGGGDRVGELGSALHSDLQRFTKLRHAVGGDEDVDLKPYVGLLLEVFTAFKWRRHVR